MSRSHAIRSGAASLVRLPLVMVAELAWRWAFSAAVITLGTYSFFLFLHSLPVSKGDLFGLSGLAPSLFKQTLMHIFAGSGPKIIKLTVVLATGFSVLWWMAASVGRAATLQALFGSGAENSGKMLEGSPTALRTIFGLNAMRVALSFAATLAYLGAVLLAAAVAGIRGGAGIELLGQGTAARFYILFLPLAVLIGAIWSMVRWHLSLAPVLAVTRGSSALRSVGDAAVIARKHAAQFAWVGLICGFFRLMLWGGALLALLGIAGLLRELPGGIVCVVLAFGALIYSAFSTVIFMVRQAAYTRIVAWDDEQSNAPTVADSNVEFPIAGTGSELPGIAYFNPPPASAV